MDWYDRVAKAAFAVIFTCLAALSVIGVGCVVYKLFLE